MNFKTVTPNGNPKTSKKKISMNFETVSIMLFLREYWTIKGPWHLTSAMEMKCIYTERNRDRDPGRKIARNQNDRVTGGRERGGIGLAPVLVIIKYINESFHTFS